jgi:UDP-GlcNAc:undecaprenyl-phosphate GlcNAc-1-phosphate transferase
MPYSYIFSFLAALTLSLVLTPIIKRLALRWGCVAVPKEDRWHRQQVPILGGVGIYIAFLISMVGFLPVIQDVSLQGLLVGATAIFLWGLWDDLKGLKPSYKLLGQGVAAIIVVIFGIEFLAIPYPFIAIPLTVLWLVMITNAFNLLDNIDGLCAGVAFIAAIILSLHSYFNGLFLPGNLAAILAGAALGFLYYNFNPAKIFMGDCGSMFLGFVLAVIALIGTGRHVSNLMVTLAVPVLILGLPIFDTLFVTSTRQLRNRPITLGGKDHTSHRLVSLGLSERKAVLLLYFIAALFGTIALFYLKWNAIMVSALGALTVIILFLFGLFLGEVDVYSDSEVNNNKTMPKIPLLYQRRFWELLMDTVLIGVSFVSAYLIRFEGGIPLEFRPALLKCLPLIIPLKLASFYYFGLYRSLWRYVSIHDLVAIFKAVSLGSILSVFSMTLIFRFEKYSRGVFVIDWLQMVILISAVRILQRVWKESFASLSQGGKRVLIMGAGDAGEIVLREIKNNRHLDYHAIGFLDDDPKKAGCHIHGLPVLGTRRDIPLFVHQKGIDEILIAIPSLKEQDLKEIIGYCKESGVSYRIISAIID